MIQFLGLHVGHESAHAVSLGRDFQVWADARADVVNAQRDAATGVVEVPPAEWVRSGAYALQETYFGLPVAARKVWGLALGGPSGWIALDPDYEPLSPLRLTGATPLAADLTRWFAENPRMRARSSLILFPKDYFRFAVSRVLATDVTDAFRSGWIEGSEARWRDEALERDELTRKHVPTVFSSSIATGTISEAGVRQTSLPSGLWIVAGAHESSAAILAATDPSARRLLLLDERASGRLLALPGCAEADPSPAPWQRFPAAVGDAGILQRTVASDENPARVLEEARAQLEAAGIEGGEPATGTARPALGAALLAMIASGLAKRWRSFYDHTAEE